MKGKVLMILAALMMMSCSKSGMESGRNVGDESGYDMGHDRIVLGERLENPYTTENMTKALQSLYPTKADRVEVKPTNLYVRFLPKNEEEVELLKGMTTDLLDHPMDFAIIVDGDWYHDPSVEEGKVTWQYAVVPHDFDFPDIEHEIIDECYIAENDLDTKAGDIDWEAVEREAYRLTGNGDMTPLTKASKAVPSGRISIVDEHYGGGKPIGVAGVKVSCNSFVKFSEAYTDRDGYYKMGKSFSARPRYRLVFKNEKGFSIGMNLILVSASVSTLGKNSPEGVDVTITKASDDKLYRRSVVNNAAYDYITRCGADDMDISAPPKDLRIWLLNSMKASSAVMLHHDAFIKSDRISSFLGKAAGILTFFLPDITIGTKGDPDYREIYSTTCHELAHASHFAKVGTKYWDKYISFIIESYIKTGGKTYGEGTEENAGYCEVGEMWAYYLESKMFKERYGGGFPTFGTSYWFYPQILRSLDERGLKADDIFSVLDRDVNSREKLKNALILAFPERRRVIDQSFSRY